MKIKTLNLDKNNKKQFNKELNKGQSIIAIVAPEWCGHCKEMMPDWNQINNEYNGMNVLEDALIGTITDDNVGLSECSKDVGGFPTIKIFDHGKETPYGGHMDKDSFDKLVKKTFKFASVGGGKSRRKYLLGLNAGKKKRKTRKRRGSGNEPEKREGEITHPALARPRVPRGRRNRTRVTRRRNNSSDGPEKWDGGRKKRRRKRRKKTRKKRKRKRKKTRKKRKR